MPNPRWRAITLILLFGTAARGWIVADDRIGVALAAFWSVIALAVGLVAWFEIRRDRRRLRAVTDVTR